MGVTESEDHFFLKFEHRCCVVFADGLCFDPLGEFIYCNQEVSIYTLGSPKCPYHIKPLDCKSPGVWNHPEFLSRHMVLPCIPLATMALLNDIFRICMSRGPVESMVISFGH